MSLPLYYVVPITAKVITPTFTAEKKHMLLSVVSDLVPTSTFAIEFSGTVASLGFKSYFGDIAENEVVQKYFNFLSKRGNPPEKLVVGCWYKNGQAPFYKGKEPLLAPTEFTGGDFTISFNSTPLVITVDLTTATSYSEIAQLIQAEIRKGTGDIYTLATCEYNTTSKGFIIRAGAGAEIGNTTQAIIEGTGNIAENLGLLNSELSDGVSPESWRDYCERIFYANTAGYSITTIEDLTDEDIKDSIAWLNGNAGEQTINSYKRLVFNFSDKARAKSLQEELLDLAYTGYVFTYDPYGEYINGLSCAICASIDYNLNEGSINFNFQTPIGYTPITQLGSVVDYQQGKTNNGLMDELNGSNISAVYSLGIGTQSVTLYGYGLMQGAFGDEAIQVNESALETELQTEVVNALVALDKLKLQGTDADTDLSVIIDPVFKKFQTAGAIARNGTLTTTDKAVVSVSFGDSGAGAIESMQNNGYYYKILPRTQDNINTRTIEVLYAYIASGVVNKVRMTSNIFGA